MYLSTAIQMSDCFGRIIRKVKSGAQPTFDPF